MLPHLIPLSGCRHESTEYMRTSRHISRRVVTDWPSLTVARMLLAILVTLLPLAAPAPLPATAPALGKIQQSVRDHLVSNPTDDTTFLLGTICTLESAVYAFSEEWIDRCYDCWPEDKTTAEGINATKECISEFLPNVEYSCGGAIEDVDDTNVNTGAGEAVFNCFLEFIEERDADSSVRNDVRKYLDENLVEHVGTVS